MFQTLSKLKSPIIGGVGIIGLAILGIIGAKSFYVNDETERAIVTSSGKYLKTTGPGQHFLIPFQQNYRQYPVSIQKMKLEGVSTSTADNYAINATIVLLYRLEEEQLENIHRNTPDYKENMKVIAKSRFKNELGNIEMANLADQRSEIEQSGYQTIKEELERILDVKVVDFTIPHYGWSDSLQQAARQQAQAETELKVARQEAKKAEAKAEQKKIQAQAEAESKRIAAEAEADSIRMKGQAEADALQAKSQALANNPELVELEKAKKWNGKLPNNMYGQARIPFLQPAENN